MSHSPKNRLCPYCGKLEDVQHLRRCEDIVHSEAAIAAATELMRRDPVVLAEVVQRHRVEFAPLLEVERARLLGRFHHYVNRSLKGAANRRAHANQLRRAG